FKVYKNENMPDKEFEEYVSSRIASASKNVNANRRKILDLWQGRGPVASHDDTTPDHVLEAISDNILISEFPTTMEAAEAAKKAGMRTVMGGPNVARGGSHSGNVSAIDLASAGLLDALSSDYAPISLIQAAFKLDDLSVMKLPQAVATVSKNPAEMLGHVDRGEIVVGKRADLVRVRKIDGSAIVRGTWVSGVQAA
ncbi:MAG: amidohydrolase family protein, partial [Rhodospirillales bacterium]